MSKSLKYEIVPGVFVIIDAEDLEKIRSVKWALEKRVAGDRFFTRTPGRGGKKISLQRFVCPDEKAKYIFFRENENDYRKQNLVGCCDKQLRRRAGKAKNRMTTSKYKGVSYIANLGLWRAGIEINGKSINLGNYPTEEKAARAYNDAASAHFGDEAYINHVR